jgi:hypothetical protein
VALGLCWEIPLSIADDYSPYPPVTYLATAPFPLPYSTILIMISASLWDGGLFLLGLLFVKIFCPAPHFEKFKGKELSVFVIYGQASELVVELISSSSHGWEFNIYPWNPLLFVFNGHNITLMPQLIWLVAPVFYYFIIIRLKKKLSDSKKIIVN